MTRQYSFEAMDIEFDPEFDEQESDAFGEFEEGEFEGDQEGGFDTESDEDEWSEEYNPDAHQWPRERTFKPDSPSVPSRRVQTGTGRCSALERHTMELTVTVGSFRRSVALVTRLTRQRPRNQQLIDDAGKKASREISNIKTKIQRMCDLVNSGRCMRADLAKGLSKITKLDGPWRTRNAEVNRLWRKLLCCLRCKRRPCRC
jgi:hypothetical protein